MTGVAYRFILDTSAVLDYASGKREAVGELIAEAADEHRLVGVPGVCLALALAEIKRGHDGTEQALRLDLLAQLTEVRVLPLAIPSLETARLLADTYLPDADTPVDLACVAYEANEVAAVQAGGEEEWDDVFVLTTEPAAYDRFGSDAPSTVDLGSGW